MNDTSPEMWKKQHEIMFKMSAYTRFMEGMEMIEFTRNLVEIGIRKQKPNISEFELKIELFKKYYSQDFSKEELENILNYFKSKQ